MKAAVRPYSRKHNRRGSAYVLFLMTAMMVTLIGMSAMWVTRVQRRSAQTAEGSAQARYYARSAVEMGFLMMNQDPAWRANLGTGDWFTEISIGTGTMSLKATLLDQGDSDPDNDSLVMTATGVEGEAIHKVQVTVNADRSGLVVEPGTWMRAGN